MHPNRSAQTVVGRVVERRVVQRFLDSVGETPCVVVIAGEAGMGKTTLWTEAIRSARGREIDVASCRATADAWSRPGLGLKDLFGIDPQSDGSSEVLVDLVVAAWRSRMARSKVLVAMDDLQWMDTVSWTVLRRAMWRLDAEPTAILATARTWSPGDPVETDPEVWRFGEVVELGPMTEDEIAELLKDDVLTRSEARRLHEATGGNPMFAEELHRAKKPMSAEGARFLRVIAGRFAEMCRETRDLLELPAVGGPLGAHTIARVWEDRDVEVAVSEAAAAGVVMVDNDFTVRFTHPLFAAAALVGTNVLGRRHVHQRLAEVSEDPVIRLVHLSRATMGHDSTLADDLAAMAGEVTTRGAHDLAADFRSQSARLTLDVELRSARQLDEAYSLAASGQVVESIAVVGKVLGDTRISNPLRTRAIAQRVFLDFEGSTAFLRTALSRSDDEHLTAMLLDLLAWQLGLYRGELAEALTLSRRAVELAHRLGEIDVEVKATCTLALVSLLTGDPQPQLLEWAVSRGEQLSLSELGRWPQVFRGRSHLWNGYLGAARNDQESSERMADQLHSQFQKPYRLHDKAMLELAAGDVATAEHAARKGIEEATSAGNSQAVVWLAYPLGLCAALHGVQATAVWASATLADWSERSEELRLPVMALDIDATSHASRGDWESALTAWTDAVDQLRAQGCCHPGALPVLPRAAEAAARTGNTEACRVLAKELSAQAAHLASAPWVVVQAEAASASAEALGGDVSSLDVLAAAVARLEDLGYRLDAVRWQLVRASIASRLGCSEVARSAVAHCRPFLAQVGLQDWIMPRSSVQDPGGDLTPVERELAVLVGEGLRNQDVAARLFISISTVESHLTRMYRKLGVRSRAGLVARLDREKPR